MCMTKTRRYTPTVLAALLILTCSFHAVYPAEQVSWRFVSMPDFLNVDTDYVQSGWEEALGTILESVKSENPDFLMVPGDLVMGEWHGAKTRPGIPGIEHFAKRYYPAWKARLKAHGLTWYTDEELFTKGTDNPRHVVKDGRGHRIVLPLNRMPSDRKPKDKAGESFDWGPFDVPDSDFGDTQITD